MNSERRRPVTKKKQSPPEHVRGYHHLSRAWYAAHNRERPDFCDEVMFGLYNPAPNGGCLAEMAVRWIPLSGHPRPSPALFAFDDASGVCLGSSWTCWKPCRTWPARTARPTSSVPCSGIWGSAI